MMKRIRFISVGLRSQPFGVAAPLLLLCASLSAAADHAPPDWPQWRGPARNGQYTGAPWPREINDDNFRQLWRVPLGPSYSGPIVAADRVFVTETRNKEVEVVSALRRADGKSLWQAEWKGSLQVPFFAASNGSWIRATPAYDGELLFVAGMRDVLVCLRAADGQEQWRVDFVAELKTPLPAFGFVSSPLVVGDAVFVQAGASLVKLDKRTGKILWRSLQDGGGMYGSAFSSPLLAAVAGREQLLVQTREKLCGVDTSDGKELWSQPIEAFRGMNILTPTVCGNQIFTSAYGGKSALFDLAQRDGSLAASAAWSNKTQGYMSSPIVIGDHVFLHLRNQRFTCINLKTGETTWTTQPFGKYWSMVAQGNRILALDERGELLLIQANPAAFDLISRRKVSQSESWAHLAVSGEEVFVRELDGIAAYRWSDAPAAPSASP